MRLLFVTNIFPNPYQPNRGVFNCELVKALANQHQVRVISPVSWVDEWSARRKGKPRLPPTRVIERGAVEVHHPRFYYTPKILRNFYGWFYWHSVERTSR